MIVFLDFDGVLHPSNWPETLFMQVPRLASWLERWPGVDVVISSSWRMTYPLPALVEMLGPVVGRRVIGATPDLWRARETDRIYPAIPAATRVREREAEILAWLAGSGNRTGPGSHWTTCRSCSRRVVRSWCSAIHARA